MNAIRLYNALGMLVKTTSNSSTIDVADFAKGIYTIKTDNGYSKFVIQ